MLVALDTETTGLDLRHGCQPFFISTWFDTEVQPLFKCVAPTVEGGISKAPTIEMRQKVELPNLDGTFEGTGLNWLLRYNPLSRECELTERQVNALEEVLTGNSIVFHNAYFDMQAMASIGIYFNFRRPQWNTLTLRELPRRPLFAPPRLVIDCMSFHDTTLLCHLYDNRGPRGLKEASLHYLLLDSIDEDTLKEHVRTCRRYCRSHLPDWKLGTNLKNKPEVAYDYALPMALHNHGHTIDGVDPLAPVVYGSLDAYRTLALYYTLSSLIEDEGTTEHYRTQRNQLVPCFNMQSTGIALTPNTDNLRKELTTNIFHREKEIKQRAKQDCPALFTNQHFNPASSKQMKNLLFSREGYGFKPMKFTDKGEPSTDKETRMALAIQCLEEDTIWRDRAYSMLQLLTSWDDDDPNYMFPEPNTGFDAWTKSKSYLDSYNLYSIEANGRKYVHPSFNPTGTDLTRYSSSNPNGQNIGKKSRVPLRKAFGPPPGEVWIAVDYSQLELRLFAAASKDDSLLRSFEEGMDFHGTVASEIFNLPIDDIPSAKRTAAKYINFGLIYGAGPTKVDTLAGFNGAFYKYRNNFPGAADFMDKTIAFATENNFVETLYGYPIQLGSHPPYKGVNCIVQGTAGQIVKYAMHDLHYHPDSPVDWKHVRIILNVHDELLFSISKKIPARRRDEIINQIMDIMERQGDVIGVHTPVDCSLITDNWMDKTDYE